MKTLIQNVHAVFGDIPGRRVDVLIVNDKISQIGKPYSISVGSSASNVRIIKGDNLYLLPGVIDSQVHFREPGLTEKATIYTESRAAVAGGVTSYMEMPNTSPPAVTADLLEEKYKIASRNSIANYSFFMGTTNDNIEELLSIDYRKVCGIKIFMGSSTGKMLVDNRHTLDTIFSNSKDRLIATHCENDIIITHNLEKMKAGHSHESITASSHPFIRNEEACYSSSAFAVKLAQKHNTRLHILHISTAKELSLFRNDIPLKEKRITAEACVHHLTFCYADYEKLGNLIKCNPAIKSANDRDQIFNAVLADIIDVICTDHAPHTLEEKMKHYLEAPSGVPFVQHGLSMMIEHHLQRKIGLQKIVQKMCNNQAILFCIDGRGFIREGYYADLVLVDLNQKHTVAKENILYKCGWSPLEGRELHSVITHTFVNGNLVYENGKINEGSTGMRMLFDR